MKYFIYTLLVLSFVMLAFNLFQIDFSDPFGAESSPGLVGVLASTCVILLMLILWVSRAIKEKSEEKNN